MLSSVLFRAKGKCRSVFFLALLLAMSIGVLPALAQSATADLSGSVVDSSGAVISGATVIVSNAATGLQRNVTTNENGAFSVLLLPPGTYTVRVERDGFSPVEVKDVVLNVNDQRSLQVQLQVGAVGQTVTVNAEASTVRDDAAVATVVDRQFVGNLPLNGRSFQSLITLTPGVVVVPSQTNYNGQFSVNGQRPEANSFSVDGVSANIGGTSPLFVPGSQTSGNLPGLTAFGTTQSLASVDALQEFKIQTSTYSAEYGRQPGGQVSIVTRSGTNQFHGSLFEYFRNDALDANNWFANQAGQPRAAMRQNDFGGTFGGPVRLPGYDGRDKTFFFFSFEALRLRQPQFALTNVPTLELRRTAPAGLQPILNSFPLPNGSDIGGGLAEFSAGYSDPSSLNATSIRIDQTINKNLTVFARFSDTPSENTQRSVADLSNSTLQKAPILTFTVGATASLTPKLANEFRFNYSRNNAQFKYLQDDFGGATPIPLDLLIPSRYSSPSAQANIFFFFPEVTAEAYPSVSDSPGASISGQHQINVVDNVSYLFGSHQLKFGIDYRRTAPVINFSSYYFEADFDEEQEIFDGAAPEGETLTQAPAYPVYVNFSTFVNDTWKVSNRLTLNLGLRWELNPAPGVAKGNQALAVTEITDLATMQLAPAGSSLWKTTFNNFAPRVGLAYQLFQRPGHETIIRAGAGLFYDTGNNDASRGFEAYPFEPFNALSNIVFPLDPNQIAPPTPTVLSRPYGLLYAFDPHLKLPYTIQWNAAIEQSLSKDQMVSVTYVGAAGRSLLQRTLLNLVRFNPSFSEVYLTTNHATSDYDSLQVQYQRQLSRRLQVLASYTWAHSLDDDSASYTGFVPQRGDSLFDVRHTFAAALTYDIPSPKGGRFVDAILGNWSADTNIHIQSAFPVDLTGAHIFNPADGSRILVRPNVVPGVSYYIDDPSAPGGRRINPAAFTVPAPGQQGNLGRNVVRGFGASQVDFALRRQFKINEKLNLQFRTEAFNLFNHPNFGLIQTVLGASNFGEATNLLSQQLGGINQLYQIGGPRSLQLALKLLF